MDSAYWGEFRTHWRPLLAATMGLGFGIGLNAYIASLFAPKLLADFGWEKSQFALLASIGLLMLVLQPVTGRLTDRFGVRVISAIGVATGPIAYIAYSQMDGDIRAYFAIAILQTIFGTLTTSPVYTRLVAERFVRARGLAFSVVMTGPPLVGAILAPALGAFIDTQGWRPGYWAVAALTLTFGIVAVLLTPRHAPAAASTDPVQSSTNDRRAGDYRAIFANPAFWVLIAAMVLVNIPAGLASAQIKLVLMDSGAAPQTATWLISAYAAGVIIGRFVCGLSLDRMEPQRVAAVALALPALGMLLMASPYDATLVLTFAIAVMGLAQGAEGDIAAYLVSRRFELRVFSLVMGLVGAAIAGGSALGAVLLSLSLRHADNHYGPFLLFGALATLVGAALFLTLKKPVPVCAPSTGESP